MMLYPPSHYCENCSYRTGCLKLESKFDRFWDDESMTYEQYLMEEEVFRRELFSE